MNFNSCIWACRKWASLCFISFLLPVSLWAQGYPAPVGFVNDFYGLLEKQQRQQLDEFLVNIAEGTSNEIVLVIMKLPPGKDFVEYSGDLARAWGIGQEGKDNGILLAVYPDKRKLRIEVGYGLEGAIPDIVASNVIELDIVPDFKEEKHFEGISKGLAALAILAKGEYNEEQKKRYYQEVKAKRKTSFWDWFWTIIMLIIIVVFWVLSLGGGYGFSSSGGGSSGGGFSGFSGGSFGGGGASGSW